MKDFDVEFKKIIEEYNTGRRDGLLSRIDNDKTTPVVVFGAGIIGEILAGNLKEFGAAVAAFCDNVKTGVNEKTQLPVITPKQLCEDYRGAIVVVGVSEKYNGEIYNQVLSLGFTEGNVYRRFNSYSLLDLNAVNRHYEGFKWAYDYYKDDTSKKVILDNIRMHLTGVEMPRSTSSCLYFDPDIICLNSNEVFVDCGAYTGDTVEEFILRSKEAKTGGYRRIYAFEPDEPARKSAERNLAKYPDIEIIGRGLWSSDTTLKFYSDGGKAGSSFVRGETVTLLPVVSLDSFFADKPEDEKPTFIKMDIEGAEKEVLLGAEGIIRKNRPKLAVCTYHKPEDVYELAQIIYSFNPGYSFQLRRYEHGIYETVLYAV